jgi:hypothetical protein
LERFDEPQAAVADSEHEKAVTEHYRVYTVEYDVRHQTARLVRESNCAAAYFGSRGIPEPKWSSTLDGGPGLSPF